MSKEPAKSIVFIVDDDASMRQALARLFRSVDLEVEAFGSTADMLRHEFPDAPSCLVLDVRLPGLSGLDFQAELTRAGIKIPIIFMTGHGDVPMSVKAMKAGAVDFLSKPSQLSRAIKLCRAVPQSFLRTERECRRKERSSSFT